MLDAMRWCHSSARAVVTLEEDQGGVAIGPHTQWDFSPRSFDPKIVHTSRLEPSDRIQ